ncbi:TIGR04282 family arsenosugar biosynthesis glycosyltransferase [Simiduia curdlanivorans]|uniref:TIGR04282 family arsenosugar biosynthesis glycosyltransferase n=1 Tax=Simiduia curdlanivorans TaxID=1492769 RepID=A0ABV8V813_9GAMM|nr:TIGR04282 family arsenosugar biosynthesis glycosyltransferase [Simiduia curdlanivorans]MDN3639616.1 TIGR04282 family arsenosugar biosynthesis glycosyltransferase [Simiduia curdlanivorans]
MIQRDRARGLIVQFAKAPIVGQVKTRLHSALTPEDATELHCALVKHSHKVVSSLVEVKCALAVAPPEHAFWREADFARTALWSQGDGNLGQRMQACFERQLCDSSIAWVILIGSDCPALNSAYLVDAIKALEQGHELVLGPATDGGYVLIAMSSPFPVFEGVDWGSAKVLTQTCAKAAGLGIAPYLLAPLADVDRPEDLAQLGQYAHLARWAVGARP